MFENSQGAGNSFGFEKLGSDPPLVSDQVWTYFGEAGGAALAEIKVVPFTRVNESCLKPRQKVLCTATELGRSSCSQSG